jgi:hypothetical protein
MVQDFEFPRASFSDPGDFHSMSVFCFQTAQPLNVEPLNLLIDI